MKSQSAPAIVFVRPGEVEIQEVEIPAPGPDEVLLRTAFSGVSQGTERWLLTGRYGGPTGGSSNVAANYPCFPGYQAAGRVEQVGDNVTHLKVGDHAMVQGTRFADPNKRNPGAGLASHVGLLTASAASATSVDPTVDLAEASLHKMAGVARHGARLARIGEGETVLVLGLGMIGQMSVQAALRRGARVVAGDLLPSRVRAAQRASAATTIDLSAERLTDVAQREAPKGFDVVIDTTGVAALFDTLVDLVRREGTILLQGYYPDPISVPFHRTHLKRPCVVFPCGWDGPEADAEIAADLENGSLQIGSLITHRFRHEDARSAYELVVNSPEATLGMVFEWS